MSQPINNKFHKIGDDLKRLPNPEREWCRKNCNYHKVYTHLMNFDNPLEELERVLKEDPDKLKDLMH